MTSRHVPELDYLTKDYAGFRRQLLDQLALHVPSWQEDNPADLGVVLVELLAHAADGLSYFQDAVSTEAYLATAQRRGSIRKHARLLDYPLHEGCNARAWVQVRLAPDAQLRLERGTPFLTGVDGARQWETGLVSGTDDVRDLVDAGATVFESMHAAHLHGALNELEMIQTGDLGVLPEGTTRVCVREDWDLHVAIISAMRNERRPAGALAALRPGDFVILEEAETALSAGRPRKHVVRLRSVHRPDVRRILLDSLPTKDLGRALDRLLAPRKPMTPERCEHLAGDIHGLLDDEPEPYVELEWDAVDALPFDLALGGSNGTPRARVRGNVVIVDHGRTLDAAPLPSVVAGQRYRPFLDGARITMAAFASIQDVPASRALHQDPRESLACIEVEEHESGATAESGISPHDADPNSDECHSWERRRDLLSSDRFSRHFVTEIDDDGNARLRFGFGRYGRSPAPGTHLTVRWRTGSGSFGNVGADAISHVVLPASPSLDDSSISPGLIQGVSNPLPASGGIDPEDIEVARRRAPHAHLERASVVQPSDLARLITEHPDVSDAAANNEWIGARTVCVVYIQGRSPGPVPRSLCLTLERHLEPYRMLGTELEVRPARRRPLFVEIVLGVPRGIASKETELVARRALTGASAVLAPESCTLGRGIARSEVSAALLPSEAIGWVDLVRFGFTGEDRLSEARIAPNEYLGPVQIVLRTEIIQ